MLRCDGVTVLRFYRSLVPCSADRLYIIKWSLSVKIFAPSFLPPLVVLGSFWDHSGVLAFARLFQTHLLLCGDTSVLPADYIAGLLLEQGHTRELAAALVQNFAGDGAAGTGLDGAAFVEAMNDRYPMNSSMPPPPLFPPPLAPTTRNYHATGLIDG